MSLPASILRVFPPAADLLLDCLRRTTDDAMLMDIAVADYGIQAEEMFEALRPIRDSGCIRAPVDGQLWEVLTLTCHHDPERPNPPPFKPGPTGRRGHQVRFFAAAVILRACVTSPSLEPMIGEATARSLVDSRILGDETSEPLARLLTWLLTQHPVGPPLLLSAALLVLAVRLRKERFSDAELGGVAVWLIATEGGEARMFGERMTEFSLGQGFWDSTAAELKDAAATIATTEVRESVQLCALLLDNGWNLQS
jgi:hypothetical protein